MNSFKNRKPVIAIDGTASSGKGTLAKKISEILNFDHLDSGRLYRALAFFLINNNVKLDEIKNLNFKKINLLGIENKILRTGEISIKSSIISKNTEVRNFLLNYQRNFANCPPNGFGSVIDGRDITSVVIPKAEVKFFIDADLDVRASRRFQETYSSEEKNKDKSYFSVRKELSERDLRDKTREISPLVKTIDSIFIDTSKLSIEETVQLAIKKINQNLEIITN